MYALGVGHSIEIAIAAAREFGARATTSDLQLASEHEKIKQAGVSDRVSFTSSLSLFEVDLTNATVVVLHLVPHWIAKLQPKLAGLKPGTRIVSWDYAIGDWTPDAKIQVAGSNIFMWRISAGK